MITSPQRGIEKGIRLVEYLTRIATIRAKLVRDISEYTNIFCPAVGGELGYEVVVPVEPQALGVGERPARPRKAARMVAQRHAG